jgi:hypothetical protein
MKTAGGVNHVFKLSPCFEWYFLVFGFTHGVWLRLVDDNVSGFFVCVPSSRSIVMLVND